MYNKDIYPALQTFGIKHLRDEQEREAMLPLQVLKEGHDLRLYGNVE